MPCKLLICLFFVGSLEAGGAGIVAAAEPSATVAATVDSLGRAYEAAADRLAWDEAIDAGRAEADLCRAQWGDDDPRTLTAMDRMAVALDELGRWDEADPLYRRVLAGRRRVLGPRHPDTIVSMVNLGSLARIEGRYREAEPLLTEAVAMRRSLASPDPQELANDLENLGGMKKEIGDHATAAECFREALGLSTSLGDARAMARGQNNLALALFKGGRYDEADSLLLCSLAIRENEYGADDPRVATVLTNLGHLRRERQDYGTAEDCMRRVVAIREVGGAAIGPDRLPSALAELAATLQCEAKFAESEALMRRALALRVEQFGDDDYRVGESLCALADLLCAERRFDEALPVLEQAATNYEHVRLNVKPGAARALYRESPYARLAYMRLMQDDGEGAWDAAELHLSRGLADVLLPRDADVAAPARPDRRALQSVLAPDEALVGWLRPWAHVSAGAANDQVWAYCIRAHGPVTWVRLPLAARDAAWDLADEGRELTEFPEWRDAPVDTSLARVAAAWLDPLRPLLADIRHLLVVVAGGLQGVPLACLPDARDGGYVGDRFAVSYVPSAAILVAMRARSSGGLAPFRSGTCFALGDPPFNPDEAAAMQRDPAPDCHLVVAARRARGATGGTTRISLRNAMLAGSPTALTQLERLPCTRHEAELVVARHAPGSVLLIGEDASEAAIRDLAVSGSLARFQTLHFATHALPDDARPLRSCLVLAQTAPVDSSDATLDGRLTAGEITAWRLHADLVTLSACQTALGRQERGEGTIGLAWAFLSAGARSVLVSLWDVEDASTALLMDRFYRNWRGTPSLARDDALREAQRWLRDLEVDGQRPYADPFFWSGFILVGDPR